MSNRLGSAYSNRTAASFCSENLTTVSRSPWLQQSLRTQREILCQANSCLFVLEVPVEVMGVDEFLALSSPIQSGTV